MKSRRRLPAVHPFDDLHGTDTSGLLPGPRIAEGTAHAAADLTAYYGVAPSILTGLLDLWLQRTAPAPIENTVFYDVGAGKGLAMMVACQYPFLRVEGVELNAELAGIAAANLQLWRRNAAVEALAPAVLHHADATVHPLPETPLCVFLFHPFEARLLVRFIRHVERAQTLCPRPLDLLYVNAEHGSLIERHPAFRCLWEGRVPMSATDHAADLAAIAEQAEYGSTGDEACAIFRYVGRRAGA